MAMGFSIRLSRVSNFLAPVIQSTYSLLREELQLDEGPLLGGSGAECGLQDGLLNRCEE
jgi:hypothetical protein